MKDSGLSPTIDLNERIFFVSKTSVGPLLFNSAYLHVFLEPLDGWLAKGQFLSKSEIELKLTVLYFLPINKAMFRYKAAQLDTIFKIKIIINAAPLKGTCL